ncbi:MAG: LamG-like jellyroll fold domain-containing protein, partial [Verrucomicrobiota bacterium]
AGGDACGGQCDDRWQGDDPYTLQITTALNPGTDTPDTEWETIGTFNYLAMEDIEPGEGFTPWLRHEYEISRNTGEVTEATGIRITVPKAGLGGGTAIDEIEIYGPTGDPRFVSGMVSEISDQAAPQTLRIPVENRGATKTLTISSAMLSGHEAYSLASIPETLAPFESGEIVIEFDPQGRIGRYLTNILITSDDEFFPEATVPISIQIEHANGLIAHYPMDETEGDQLIDASGNNYHGSYINNGGTIMLGQDSLASGTAVRFSGDLAFAEVPPEAGLPPLQTFSVSMWVNFDPDGAGNFSSFISKGAELGKPFSLIANVDGPLQFFSDGLENDPTEATIGTGEAYHVVLTHEDKNGPKEIGESEVRLYLNGDLVFENLESDGFDDRNPSPLQIAATAGLFGMTGIVDDVQLYQIEMTPENVVFLKENPGSVLPGRPLVIRPADGFAIEWDGNDGEFFDPGAPPEGATVPENLALAGTPFSSSDLGPEINIDFHRAHNLTDGLFGNANSWISASGDANPFVGVTFERPTDVMAVAWSRDNGNGAVDDSDPGADACGGQCDDRAGGVYTLQVTTVSNPDASTLGGDWTTVGTFDYRENEDVAVGGGFTTFLRHQYNLSREGDRELIVSGIRLLVPAAGLNGGTAIDELEVYGIPTGIPVQPAEGFSIRFDGNQGERFEGIGAFPNDALASNGAIPFSSSDLGPELNINFHIVDNVNDGVYGNSHSWISGSDDPVAFLGVDFGKIVDVSSVAWGRDNLGQFNDRSDGVYTLQVTMADGPDAETEDDLWTTVGTFHYDEAIGTDKHLRHRFEVARQDGSPIPATGVRLLVPSAGLNGGTAIDELEVNPSAGPGPTILSTDGYSVSWNRNDGDHFVATPPPDGALVPDNLALVSNGGEAISSGDLGPELGVDFHVAGNLNDGFYGNSNSWIGASEGDGPFYAGVHLPETFEITAVAWGRDNGNGAFDNSDPGSDACGGQCIDRWTGLYQLQITTDNDTWTTIATMDYGETGDTGPGGTFTGYLRHEFAVVTADGSPVVASGIRILTPTSGLDGGTAIDEIEVYGQVPAADPELVWDGSDGDFFDPVAPPEGALVPDNLALASNGATAFASGELGPQLNIDFHVAANLNDGVYGNSNSWIGTAADVMFAGIDLGGLHSISAIAWGRDNGNGAVDDSDPGSDACGGQCDDRWQGTYTVQVTTDPSPQTTGSWRTVGVTELAANEDNEIGGGFTGYLRHGFTFAEGLVEATGVRIVVSNPATAIDEIEIYSSVDEAPGLIWDGNDGLHFDATPPPEGSAVPDNFA